MGGLVESVNVGAPRPVEVGGHTVLTAIWKHPVEGRVPVRGVNLRGDDQADRSVHGGPDKAVYAYAAEDEEWWGAELDRELGDRLFPKRFAAAGRPGAYLRIVREGDIGAGDPIDVVSRPAHGVTSALVSRALVGEPELLPKALAATELPAALREWMAERAEHAAARPRRS
jgi:MOSC domain-containing protein YiiM